MILLECTLRGTSKLWETNSAGLSGNRAGKSALRPVLAGSALFRETQMGLTRKAKGLRQAPVPIAQASVSRGQGCPFASSFRPKPRASPPPAGRAAHPCLGSECEPVFTPPPFAKIWLLASSTWDRREAL